MKLIESIRGEFSEECTVDKLERSDRSKCTVCLHGTPKPYLLIDLDLPGAPLGQSDVRCDYLVFVNNVEGMLCVAPVEFKSSWRGKIVSQLQAGAKAAERYIPEGFECRFRPVGVLNSFPKGQRRIIRQNDILFWGQSKSIQIVICGDRLMDVLLG